MTRNKTITYISGIIALMAVVALVVSPLALAEMDAMGSHKGKMQLPPLEFTDTSVPVGESHSESLAADVISITEAIDSIEGRVVMISLMPVQEYLAYFALVISGEEVFHVIVDAGNGDVLYTSDGMSIADIDAKMAEMKSKHSGMSGMYSGMTGEYDASKHTGMTGMVDHTTVLEPTGNEELDALRAEFVEKMQEIKQAHADGDFDKVKELAAELEDLRNQIIEVTYN